MKQPGVPDSLTIINGPEDGAEFSMVRTPLSLGTDPTCTIQIRLDRAIQPLHARVSAAPDGYRIRCSTATPAFVNGRRIGRARSRVLRNGDVLKVGHTELVLECAPDGLASRSRGISTEADAIWLIKSAGSALVSFIWSVFHWCAGTALALLRGPKFLIVAVTLGALMIWPESRYWLIAIVRVIAEDLRAMLQ